MKKIIAFALTLILLCSIGSAFAATNHVVGTHGDNAGGANSANDGVVDFSTDPKNPITSDVTITVQANGVQHRYAVDVEFQDMSFNLEGTTFTWDVNKLQYVQTGEAIDDPEFVVTVYNYSDLPVYVDAVLADGDANDNLAVAIDGGDLDGELVEAAYTGAATGTEQNIKFTITANPSAGKTWSDVARYYANKGAQIVGTCTVTIAKDNA